MEFNQLVKEVREQFINVDISEILEKLAFQFNLEGDGGGTFYTEIKDGVLSVEPYEYIDRDVLFIVSVENFMKLINGNLDPIFAYTTGKLKVEGDIGKALQIKKLLSEPVLKDTDKQTHQDNKIDTANTKLRRKSNKK